MNALEAVILGAVQGITEFLPISSTGHLILVREFLGADVAHGLAVDATLHFATALAVIIYFRADISTLLQSAYAWATRRFIAPEQRTLLLALILGTIPAVIAGLFLQEYIDTVFRNPHLVAWVLIIGSALFLCAEYVHRRTETKRELTVGRGVLIGLFQMLALIPGMSRSGATISGGMLLGLSREAAARFAFLLAIPIILGAGGVKVLELGESALGADAWIMIGLAALVAFLSGLAAIHYLLRFLKNHSLAVFIVYRIVLALLVFAVL